MSGNGMWLTAGFAEELVQIWDMSNRCKTAELSTIFRFGSENLAIGGQGDLLVVTDTGNPGCIVAYDVPTKAQLWRRDGLAAPARPAFRSAGERLWYSELGARTVECVDARTGLAIRSINDCRTYIEGPHEVSLLVPGDKSRAYVLTVKDRPIKVKRLTFALLAATFAPGCLFVSESGGPIRCVDCADGSTRWAFDPAMGSHALRLHYNSTDKRLYAVVWEFERGLSRRLLRFDPVSGEEQFVCDLWSWEECFIPGKEQLVTSEGLIIDLATGTAEGTLAFPRIAYPDVGETA